MNLDIKKSAQINKKDAKKLLTQIKQRDKEAFIKAYDLYVDQIYRFVYFKVSNQEDAQDITSTVFLKTWDYLQKNSMDDFRTVRGLIYRIARTTVIDHYRKNSAKTNVDLENEDGVINIADETQNILQKTADASDLALIESKLKKIKEEYREIIILKYLEDLSTAEIASVIEKSRGNTRVLIHRALNALKKIIEEDNEQQRTHY